MASVKPSELPQNVPEKVKKSYEKANTGTNILEKGKEVLEKGKEKVKELLQPDQKKGDLPPNLPEKVKESYRKANLDTSKSTLLDKGKETLEKGKETLEKGKEKVKEMFRPELDLPRNIPERVRDSHLQYSTQLIQDQPTLLEKGKETLERGKEKIKEMFQREDDDVLPSDVPERVKESHKKYDASAPDTESLLQRIEGTLETTYEKGKEKVKSLFRSEHNQPEFGPNTPQIVIDSYSHYDERLREVHPSLLEKGKEMIKGIFKTKRAHLDVPMYVPERVRQSHEQYEASLTTHPSLIEKGKEMVKEMLGI